MKSTILTTLALAMQISAYAQDRVELLQKNTWPISSINVTDTSADDLEAMAKAIGESRIVMLGEMDAGDAETMRAKSRIVRYLHQKMGFTVLAFQADFYATNSLWDNHGSPDSLAPVLTKWNSAAEFQGLQEYLTVSASSGNPLNITGFAPNSVFEQTLPQFMEKANEVFNKLGYGPNNTNYSIYLHTLTMATDLATMRKMDDTTFYYLKNTTRAILADLNGKPDADRGGFFRQSLHNFLGQAYWCHQNRDLPDEALDATIQNKQMAANLLWLADKKYAGKKIIVWGNNQLVSKNSDRLEVRLSNYNLPINTTMGSELAKVFEDELFAIGFSSLEGKTPALTSKEDTLDIRQTGVNDWYTNLLGSSPFQYAFTDFRKIREHEELDAQFTMRGWGYQYEIKGEWFHVFDGMFYIRTNQATTNLSENATAAIQNNGSMPVADAGNKMSGKGQ
jgi:hypothetical protein